MGVKNNNALGVGPRKITLGHRGVKMENRETGAGLNPDYGLRS